MIVMKISNVNRDFFIKKKWVSHFFKCLGSDENKAIFKRKCALFCETK